MQRKKTRKADLTRKNHEQPLAMLAFRCPADLHERMARAAAADKRTLSNWLRLQLERLVAA